MATWSTFREQVRRELEETTAGVWSDTSLLWWANEAVRDLSMKTKPSRDWVYTTTVSGTSTYDLPDNSLEVIEVYCGKDADDDRRQLVRQDFRDWSNLDIADGKPVYYAIDDTSIILRPAPDDAYELSFLRYSLPTELSADSDPMPFEDRYDQAINYYIKSKAYEQVLDWNSADALLGRYNAAVETAQIQETHEANSAYRASTMTVY